MAQIASSGTSLTRSLGSLETWGLGFSGLLLWLGIAPTMNVALGPAAMRVWIPGTIVGVLLNLQIKRLGTQQPNVAGGTPNYTSRLLERFPLLARYSAIGYWLGWVSVPPMNAIILTDLIQENLAAIGIDSPVFLLRTGFTLLPFVVAFSNTRTIGILHTFFVVPALLFLGLFCVQGLGWLAIAPTSPGLVPATSGSINFVDWAKWFFIAVYAVYGCETASSFVADSQKPKKTLDCLVIAAIAIPIVYTIGSWVLACLATSDTLGDSAYLHLMTASRPFWGDFSSGLVTFLIASGCLLSSATAVSNCPQILYQLAKDHHLPNLFSVVSPRGVLELSLLFTLIVSLLCLLWGNISRVVMVTGTGYLTSMMAVHLGLWLQRKHPEVLWPRWSLGFLIVEAIVFVVGGLSWGWQDWAIGLLLPAIVVTVATALPQLPIAPLRLGWWLNRYRHRQEKPRKDWVVFQVTVLIILLCSAVSIGWFTRARLDYGGWGKHNALFSIVLITVAFLGVAIACWTTLSQVAAITEAREQLEQTLTDLQQTQIQLVQSEKMSSLGQLVAGVAHEINNPVNFIYGNLSHVREYTNNLLSLIQLYQKHYPQPVDAIQQEIDNIELDFLEEDLVKILSSMKMGSERIREIVLSLRNFSRLDEADLKPVDLHEGIDSTITILKHRLKAKANRPAIKIIKDYVNLPLVECYPGQLNQVIMNIMTNAIDAIEDSIGDLSYHDLENESKWIKIRTSAHESGTNQPTANEQPSDLPITPSSTISWVEIAIMDNGCGIPEPLQKRIFDPFFTTKPIGKGTGMGMSISYQIVTEKHGGRLKCHSIPGQGTEFLIQIPLRSATQPVSR